MQGTIGGSGSDTNRRTAPVRALIGASGFIGESRLQGVLTRFYFGGFRGQEFSNSPLLLNRWTKTLLLRRVCWSPHHRCAFRNHRVADALVPLIGVATLDLAQRDGDKHYTDQRAPIHAV